MSMNLDALRGWIDCINRNDLTATETNVADDIVDQNVIPSPGTERGSWTSSRRCDALGEVLHAGPGSSVAVQGPSETKMVSPSPGHGGMVTPTAVNGSSVVDLNWNAVPTGIVIVVPGRTSTVSPF